ncbi:MAG: NAD(P)H-binding protein [Paracoccaceae bacterium]|nr:NAD(P)H-binding protein [Paracoccaceae bacterium]MDP7184988.1 NAD(P)H-binding protein [Paracoccaceae bacterium]
MHAVLTGGTGMVGGSVLRALLSDNRITKVTSISRRSTGLSHAKLTEIQTADFGTSEGLEAAMQGADILFHCIATYAHKVDAATYETITVTYLETTLAALAKASPNARVCHFSASGAAPNGKSWYKALNTKGRAENALFASGFPVKIAFRPGLIVPTRPENHKGFGDTMGKLAFRLLPFIGTTADDLAWVMVDTALSDTPDGSVFGPADIPKLLKALRRSKGHDRPQP